MLSIIKKYTKIAKKRNINKELTLHIFKKLDIQKYIEMMNISNNMPNNNMNRMFISYFRENLIAHLLNIKYVGDDKIWETDCVYPKNVNNPNELHIKYEIKIQKKMFLKNGNTNGIILKNGRREGSKIKYLLNSILKNNFLLINGTFPYNIAYVIPTNFFYYLNGKKNARTFDQIINDDDFLNTKCAELYAYVKKQDLIYLYKYNNSLECKYISTENTFNPFKKIIDEYILENF